MVLEDPTPELPRVSVPELPSAVVPEFPCMVPELTTPPVTAKKAFPVSPAMAKRAVFAFYVLAVLCACNTHMASSDLRTVCYPEPADDPEAIPGPTAGPKAIPEQPALHDMITETITEQPALPDMATTAIEAILLWLRHSVCLGHTHIPPGLLSSSRFPAGSQSQPQPQRPSQSLLLSQRIVFPVPTTSAVPWSSHLCGVPFPHPGPCLTLV